jgi:hypothetical protein
LILKIDIFLKSIAGFSNSVRSGFSKPFVSHMGGRARAKRQSYQRPPNSLFNLVYCHGIVSLFEQWIFWWKYPLEAL